jgi:hypothetical protein
MDRKISEELAQSVINYLATRPYQEVFQLINGLTNLPKIKDDKEVEEDKSI